MKKFFLLNLLLTTLVAGVSTNAIAQYSATLGARLIVNAPSVLGGSKAFSYSSDTRYTGPWGGSISGGAYYHVPLVKIADSLASVAVAPGTLTGKWVLIFRGTYQFSQKAFNVQQGGAAGVVIVNNVPGADPVGMGAGTNAASVTIPVLMVSNPDGLALNAALNAGLKDTISLTTWGFGLAHDLAMVSGSNPLACYGAVPFSHVSGANGQSQPYNMYSGGFAANIGTNNEAGVVLGTDIFFTPTAGGTTKVYGDTINIGTFNKSDSIVGGYSTRVYHPAPSGNGRYDINTYVYATQPDLSLPDDTVKSYSYVTDSVFCLGRWDAAHSKPISSGSEKFASATNSLTWGPLFFIKDGPYQAVQVQFGVNDGDTSKHDLSNAPVTFVFMLKWLDGSAGAPLDSIIQEEELVLTGIASKQFGTADSNEQKFIVPVNNPQGTPGTKAYLAANSWYYFAADLGTSLSMDVDGYSNYYGRLQASKIATKRTSYCAPNTNTTFNAFTAGTSLSMLPFLPTNNIDSVGIRSFDGLTPAFALYTSKNHSLVGVEEVAKGKDQFTLYPNPAVGANIHVRFDLPTRSAKVYLEIADALGRGVYRQELSNIQGEDIEMPTAKLPAGNYYMAIRSDNATMAKAFTVIAK